MDGRTEFRRELGQQLRVDSVRASAAAGSGHPTSSMSAADLIAVLIDGRLREDDHLIFSKGHASPLYYAMLKATGRIDDAELLTFRKLGSRLEGHPTPRIPPTDVATGSLGQGLPIAAGIALAGQAARPPAVPRLVPVRRLRDGRGLDVGVDPARRLGGPGQPRRRSSTSTGSGRRARRCSAGTSTATYAASRRSAGTRSRSTATTSTRSRLAYEEAETIRDRPTAIVARTKKGRGVKAVEDQPGKHGKPLDDPDAAIAELGGERDLKVQLAAPAGGEPHRFEAPGGELPSYELGEEVATRKAYGEALAALGSIRGDVVALDGEVSNSTHSEDFRAAHEDRYFEMFIAEQQLVAAAVGFQVRGWVPFASTFAAFLSRAYDFVRMAAISRANIRLSGSHAGVSIGEDGPSQMALEDIASLRAITGSTVLHPSDANQAAQLVAAMADTDGVSFMRTLRGKTPVRTRARRGRPHRRQPDRPRGRRRRDRRLRHHGRRGRARRRGAGRRRASRRACSTATRSSRSTPRPCARRRATAAP